MKTRSLLISQSILIGAFLTACGGGGGGDSGGGSTPQTSANSNTTYSLITPTALGANPSSGSASFPTAVSDYGVGVASFPLVSSNGFYGVVATYNAASTSSFPIFPTTHLDSSVLSAWASGWTGKGSTISVIDDFTNASITITNLTPTFTRTATYDSGTYGQVQASHQMAYKWNILHTHGALVANIAGGDADGQQSTASFTSAVESDTKTSCSIVRAGTGANKHTSDCDANYYIQSLTAPSKTLNLSYKRVAGIAKEANVVPNNLNLSSSQNPIQTVTDLQGHLRNSSALGFINLSLGADIPTTGKTFSQVMSAVEGSPIPKINSVVTVAAGNGGRACATEDLSGCNAVAIALAYQTASNASTIIVGALSGSGSNQNIATYSTRAGILAPRFILASGESGYSGLAGTSFAAPRVAGVAAILGQRFPKLTPPQIANIILLSADKDINNDGANDFSGVSTIYGHGKLSLTRALALASSL